MSPEFLVSLIDFRYCSDVLTKQDAINILKEAAIGKEEREKELLEKGYPAYTTAAGMILKDKHLFYLIKHFK